MTDRINYLTVVLENDLYKEDAQDIANAIAQLRGVRTVAMNITQPGDFLARENARLDLVQKLWDVLK